MRIQRTFRNNLFMTLWHHFQLKTSNFLCVLPVLLHDNGILGDWKHKLLKTDLWKRRWHHAWLLHVCQSKIKKECVLTCAGWAEVREHGLAGSAGDGFGLTHGVIVGSVQSTRLLILTGTLVRHLTDTLSRDTAPPWRTEHFWAGPPGVRTLNRSLSRFFGGWCFLRLSLGWICFLLHVWMRFDY